MGLALDFLAAVALAAATLRGVGREDVRRGSGAFLLGSNPIGSEIGGDTLRGAVSK